jgi:hypothetical protein
VGALLVTVAPVLIGGVVDVVVSWLRRQPDTVEVVISGQQFRGRVTRDQRDALVAAVINETAGGADSP